ncbi:MAG: hypothetical protein MAG795_00934 [Candidatus Woesearchaeota archaeon]|nr:hypothetical protein [Candidatus Woesearchaeota archaeon]
MFYSIEYLMKTPDPYKELFDNLELISPVKKCPECGKLTLKFDPKQSRIHCSNCSFERYMKK